MVSYLFCWFLLQASFGAVSSGTSMFAYSEMSFPLFSNLTFHKHIILYKNGNEKSVIIARWEMENATIISEWKKHEYIRKIFIDIDKTPFIWICKGDQTDSAKYIVIYDINTPGPEVELAIIEEFTEKKQLHVCLNSPPNSPEKCFGKLTEEQVGQYIEKWLDNHPKFIKRYFGNLKEENIGDEFRKWLDDHPGFMKKYFKELTGEQIGQEIQKWLGDHPESFKKYFGKLTEQQDGQEIRKWLDDRLELLKKHIGSSHLPSDNSTSSYWTMALQLVTLLMLTLYIIFNNKSDIGKRLNSCRNLIIARLPYYQRRLESSHKDKDAVVVNIEKQEIYNKNLERKREKQFPGTLTFEDLDAALNEPLTDRNIDLGHRTSSEETGILETTNLSSGSYNENQKKGEIQLYGMPTFKDLGVTLKEPMTERNTDLGQRTSSEEKGILETTNLNAGSYTESMEKKGELQLPGMPTFQDLGVILMETLTERYIDLGQRMSSEENGILETTNLSSDLFYQSGSSLAQPINKEGDSGQTKRVKKPKHFIDEDSAESMMPLLGDQKALNQQK